MGLSSSSSSSSTKNYTEESSSSSATYTTGGSGTLSPTITGSNNTVINTDAGQTANALAGMQAVSLAALSNATSGTQAALNLLSNFNSAQSAGDVQQQQDNNDLLSSVLAQNSTLANNVQSGGATTGMELTTKVVLGALAVVGLIVAVLLFRK